MAAIFSCGKRDNAPWQTSDETASSIGRHAESIRMASGLNGSISVPSPTHSLAKRS